MFNPLAYANAAPAGVAVLETSEPTLPFVPLRRTTVNGRWEGALAELTFTHTYAYTRSQCERVLEAVYRFPLPGDAAVRRVVVTFGEVEIVATLQERRAAEQAYEEARRQGYQGALTTREAPDVFTLRVTGLQPDQEVVVETTCVVLAEPEGHSGPGWRLRLPLTTAPRYSRADERGQAAHAAPLAVYRDPGHRFALDLLTAYGRITSTTHALRDAAEDGHTRVRLAAGELLPDRDCVLTWRPLQAQNRPVLDVLAEPDGAGRITFMALVAPPSVPQAGPRPPLEAILLVDHSGSMSGDKWRAADAAAIRFLRDLQPGDFYNVGVFESRTRWLSPAPRPVGPDAADQALRFLQAERDGGGTELGVALEQALLQRRAHGTLSRHIVVITDAQVSDEARLSMLVESEAERADRRRLSILCIDTAPNAHLTNRLATLGGGTAAFLTSRPGEGDMASALEEILGAWSQPLAVGITLEVNRQGLELSDARPVRQAAGGSTIDLGDLTLGRSLWVAGRVPAGEGELILRLVGPGMDPVEQRVAPAAQGMGGALKALFGAYRVQGLETLAEQGEYGRDVEAELRRLGYDPAHLLGDQPERAPLYAENAGHQAHATIEDLLVAEALEYGLLCSRTGFVAIRRERGQVVEETMEIGNALPEGWEGAGFLTMPDMAAPASPAVKRQALYSPAWRSGPLLVDAAPVTFYQAAKSVQDTGAAVPVFYAGRPVTGTAGEVVLFDTDRAEDARRLAGELVLHELAVRGLGAPLDAATLPRRLAILVEHGGAAIARLRLVDLLRHGGRRPVSLVWHPGERLRLVLVDPEGAWANAAPAIEVEWT